MDSVKTLFTYYHNAVQPEWIDANNHMNVAFYVLAFDLASDAFLNEIGGGEKYIKDQEKSFFIVEMNVSYQQELHKGDPLAFNTQLIGVNEKKIHLYHKMYHRTDGYLAATNEILMLHIDMVTRRSTPMGENMLNQLNLIKKNHEEVPLPNNLSRQFKV